MVDLLQIEQILINLLRNAIEAIGESGTLRGTVLIEAKVFDADFVEVRVVDTGPGFPAQLLENAFLPLSSARPKASALDCRCAGRSSRPMAASYGSMTARRAPPFTLRCPSQRRPRHERSRSHRGH